MNTEARTLAEITRQAIEILYRELGVVDTMRFLNQYSLGHGDYTKDREEWLGDISLEDAIAQIKAEREENA